MKKHLLIIGICLSFLCACADGEAPALKKAEPEQNTPTKQADENKLQPVMSLSHQDGYLVIPKSDLKKEFLLLPSFKSSTYMVKNEMMGPTVSSLLTKIVYFEKKNDHVVMFENTQGIAQLDPVDIVKTLAECPIISEDEETIVFDYRNGMDRLIVSLPAFYGANGQDFIDAPQLTSYLDNFNSTENLFYFDHVASFEKSGHSHTATFNYAFYPYVENHEFVPLEKEWKPDYYLKVTGLLHENSTEEMTLIQRWDISKPIVFSISDNTPEKYRQAIKKGAMSWNALFDKPIIQVVDASTGVMAGDPRYNVIQWVEWDDRFGAYADVHTNSKTGEIIHANVVLFSGLAKWADDTANEGMKSLANDAGFLSLTGFESKDVHVDMFPLLDVESIIDDLNITDFERDEILWKFHEAFIMNTVAHEVGHVLGLRHNHLASMETEIDDGDISDELGKLIRDERDNQSPLTASSLMDYVEGPDAVLMGRPGKYDESLIRQLYYNETYDGRFLFCTDQHKTIGADCLTFDHGRDPLKEFQNIYQERLNRINEELEGGNAEDPIIKRIATNLADSLSSKMSRYIDGAMIVIDLPEAPEADRRQSAMETIHRYLDPNQLVDGVPINYCSKELLSYIDLTSDDKKVATKETLNDIYLNNLSVFLGTRVQGGFVLSEQESVAEMMTTMWKDIITHRIDDKPALPLPIRELALRLLVTQKTEIAYAAKERAIQATQTTIATLEERFATEATDALETAIAVEKELLRQLQGAKVAQPVM